MKTALIMGISGGFGRHVAQALVHQGWHLKALLRNPAHLPEHFHDAEVIQGDAGNIEDVRLAAEGADLIVYAVNPANYHWDGVVLPLLENTAKVAEENGQTVVFPGNVYVFDPDDGPDFDELSPIHPPTSKGEMRKAMETRLKLASERGAKVIIFRMGDFIGAGAPSTWLCQLIKPMKSGYNLLTTGPQDLIHSWTYLPDAANTVAQLAAIKDELKPYNVFHFKGYRVSFLDMAHAIEQASGKDVKLKPFPWLVIRLLAPFNALFRGLVEMRYLWQTEINLTDDKLHSVLNKPIPQTPLVDALVQSNLFVQSKANTQN